jgi:ubiquinone/menaquinone biosynthesis C-methylase UbiE
LLKESAVNEAKMLRPSAGFQYYSKTIYWNNFDLVNAIINTLITGRASQNWMQHTLSKYGPFDKLYSINCGNGWVERALYNIGAASWIFGSDINAESLAEAAAEAARIGMPAQYGMVDANNPKLPDIEFDCVLNHAAMHHVAFIDQMFRTLCVHCKADGYLISFDYIGPHRNQYPWESWSIAMQLWHELPVEYRTVMTYPHQATMIALDPTEAVHAELIVSTMKRYFNLIEAKALGGAIAYPLLFENRGLFDAVRCGIGTDWLQRILDVDTAYTEGQIDRSLFAFFVAQPNKSVLGDQAQLDAWSAEECAREAQAIANGGRYFRPEPLEIIYDHFLELESNRQNG